MNMNKTNQLYKDVQNDFAQISLALPIIIKSIRLIMLMQRFQLYSEIALNDV
jgi:hypothetical protein